MLSLFLRTLLLGLVFFLLGGVLIFLGLARGSGGLLGTGIVGLGVSVATLTFGVWLSRRQPQGLERRREQRLWKSGPLGRKWLEARRRIH